MTALRLETAVASDVGRVRDHNEDAWLLRPGLAVVADGMGGHLSGDVASRLAVDTVARAFGEPPRLLARVLARWSWSGEERLARALVRANRRIFFTSTRRRECRGMGTTVVALYLEGDRACIAHVGDSRVYRLRDGELQLMTTDHSLLNEYLELGLLSPDDAARFPYKNVIVRALGLSPFVEVDTQTVEVRPGDRFLLCSDGLTDLVDEGRIRRQLEEDAGPQAAATALVGLALDAGGTDNVTAVVAHVQAEDA